MKQKLTLLATIAFGCVALLLWLWPRMASLGPPPVGLGQSVHRIAAPSRRSSPGAADALANSHQYRFLDWTDFCRKFSLSGWESYEISGILTEQACDWNEEKGQRAEVSALDGKVLKMHVPSLDLSQERCRRVLEARLTPLLGAKRTQEICADAKGWETLLRLVRFEELNFDSNYTITRVKEEDLSQPLSLGYALFDAEITNRPTQSGTLQRMGFLDETLVGADIDRLGRLDYLGWNAMAKIPAGYIRTAPILGVASRPAPMVVVINNLDTDTAEIRNLQGDGSTETVKIGDPMPTGP